MALDEVFPNYIWNLSVSIAMESGAQIAEIVDMCQPVIADGFAKTLGGHTA